MQELGSDAAGCATEGCENKRLASSTYCSQHARAFDLPEDSLKKLKALAPADMLKFIEPCLQHLLRMLDSKDTLADAYMDIVQAMAEETLGHCGASGTTRKRVKHIDAEEKKAAASTVLALDEKGATTMEWTLPEVEAGVDTFLDGILQGCLSMFEKTAGVGPDALWRPVPDEFTYKNQGIMAVWEATLLESSNPENQKMGTLCVTIVRDFSQKVANVSAGKVEPQTNTDQKAITSIQQGEEDQDDFFQFESMLPSTGRESKGAILDIKVLAQKREDKVPAGYEVLRQSLDGQGANLNKPSGKHMYLCIRHGFPSPGCLPVTAVAVLFTSEEVNEYAPFGFTAIEDSLTPGSPANLGTTTFPVFLAVRKGQGTPLRDVSILFRERGAGLPTGYHEILRTPSGAEADVNSRTSGIPCFVCLCPDITAAILPFREFVKKYQDGNGKAPCREESFAHTLAVLVAALYCYRRDLPKTVFDAFRLLPMGEIPEPLLNMFIKSVCGVLPLFWGWAAPVLRTNSLAFLLMLLEDNLHSVSVASMLHILSVFAFVQQAQESGQSTGHKLATSMAHLLSRFQPRPNLSVESTAQTCVGFLSKLANNVADTKRLVPFESTFFSKTGDVVSEIGSILDVLTSKPIEFDGATMQINNHAKLDYERMESLAGRKQSAVAQALFEIAEQERKALADERLSSVQRAKQRAVQGEEIASTHQDLFELRRKPMLFMAVPRGELARHQNVVIKVNLMENYISFHVVEKRGDSLGVTHFPRDGLKSIKKMDPKSLMMEFNKPREFKKEYTFQATDVRDAVFDVITKHMSNNPLMRKAGAGAPPPPPRVAHSPSILRKGGFKEEMETPADTSFPQAKDLFFAVSLSWHRTEKLLEITKKLQTNGSELPPLDSIPLNTSEEPSVSSKEKESKSMYKTPALKQIDPADFPAQIELEKKFLAMLMFACKLALQPEGGSSVMHLVGRQSSQLVYPESRVCDYGCGLLVHALTAASAISMLKPSPSFHSSFHEALPLPEAYAAVIRKFVCPTLVHCSISPLDPVVIPTLQSIEQLWKKYQRVCPRQNGILMRHFGVDCLRSPYINPLHKIGILDLLNNTVLSSFENAMHVFLNYDNQDEKLLEGFDVYKHMLKTVCEIAISQARELYYKRHVQLPIDSKETKIRAENAVDALRIRCFALLADYAERSAVWIKHHVPKCGPDKLTQCTGRLARGIPWVARYGARKDKDAIFKQAVEAFKKTKKIKAALTVIKENLKELDVGYNDKVGSSDLIFPRTIAHFLRVCGNSLDKVVIGDTLSMFDDPFMHNRQWLEIRRAFLSEMNFTQMTFDESLRFYLIEGGFRLPGEAQKIDRLLEVFCDRYCICNPGVFKSSTPAFLLAFAMIMLNTDIHDVRLQSGKAAKREKMTLNQFCNNLRGTNDGEDFPRALLEEAYQCIANEEIAWKEAQVENTPLSADPSAEPEDEATRVERLSLKKRQAREAREKARKQELSKSVRNTKMQLHQKACSNRVWEEVTQDMHTGLSLVMWDLTWQPLFATLSHAERITGREVDITILNHCLRATRAMKEISEHLEADGPRHKAFEELDKKLTFRVAHVQLRRDIEASKLIKDYRYHLKKYPNCLCASELIDWMVVNNRVDVNEAVELGRNLAQVGLSCIVGDAKEKEVPFKEDKRLYEFKAIAEVWGAADAEEDDLDDIDETKEPQAATPTATATTSAPIATTSSSSSSSLSSSSLATAPPPPPQTTTEPTANTNKSPALASAPSSLSLVTSLASASSSLASSTATPKRSAFSGWRNSRKGAEESDKSKKPPPAPKLSSGNNKAPEYQQPYSIDET